MWFQKISGVTPRTPLGYKKWGERKGMEKEEGGVWGEEG
jgi:hypothetical protein